MFKSNVADGRYIAKHILTITPQQFVWFARRRRKIRSQCRSKAGRK